MEVANKEEKNPEIKGSKKKLIAVTMATSRQGMAVVRNLLKSGNFQVRAITRNPMSKEGQVLRELPHVEVWQGDLLDRGSLENCFKGVYGIFGNTTPRKGWNILKGSMDQEYELEQGLNLINATKNEYENGELKHFIFSSICKPKDPLKKDPAPIHFTNKWNIEDYIEKKKLMKITTIIRPVSYFENFDSGLPGLNISETIFPGLVSPEVPWQTIAVNDIGKWVNAAFNYPEKFIAKSLNIAGEELSGKQMASVLKKVNARFQDYSIIKYYMIPRIIIKYIEHDLAIMANWIERTGYGANLEALNLLGKEVGVENTTLEDWLKRRRIQKEKEKKKDTKYRKYKWLKLLEG